MVKRNYKKVMVNKTELKRLLKEKGVTLKGLSEEMGYGATYLSNKIGGTGKGQLNMSDARYIEAVYGIKADDYALKPEAKTEVKVLDSEEALLPRLTQSQMEKSMQNVLGECQFVDYERMYKVMYSAMYEAMTQALKGE